MMVFLQDKGRVDKKFVFTSFPLLILQGLCLSVALLFNAADASYLPCDFWGWIVSWMRITNNFSDNFFRYNEKHIAKGKKLFSYRC